MTERPIIFSAPMVNAILAGKKNVTRRIVKFPLRRLVEKDQAGPEAHCASGMQQGSSDSPAQLDLKSDYAEGTAELCPYGQPGTTLWLKEAFYAFGRWEMHPNKKSGRNDWRFIDMTLESGRDYCVSEPANYIKTSRTDPAPTWWLRPSLFMPRRASRVDLEVTDVRIERLRDITDEQARAEGFSPMHDGVHTYFVNHLPHPSTGMSITAVIAFALYWQRLHGNDSWNENPWVWVVSFRRLDKSTKT
ncbi:hypothetical protein [Pseudomonas syringae]|uniref:hypothetical protein n=1 Tax=Pseudomonas syringae TaxID=317 RepID=UPI000B114776|nr:hypothetical protein [Pseudomonas syringae]